MEYVLRRHARKFIFEPDERLPHHQGSIGFRPTSALKGRTYIPWREWQKHSASILEWARRGAEARWNELQAEASALLKAFPDLAAISRTARRTVATSARGVADIGNDATQSATWLFDDHGFQLAAEAL